jgi:hypothetical protein
MAVIVGHETADRGHFLLVAVGVTALSGHHRACSLTAVKLHGLTANDADRQRVEALAEALAPGPGGCRNDSRGRADAYFSST